MRLTTRRKTSRKRMADGEALLRDSDEMAGELGRGCWAASLRLVLKWPCTRAISGSRNTSSCPETLRAIGFALANNRSIRFSSWEKNPHEVQY